MRKDHTRLVLVLDASGSMGRVRDETCTGFNKLIAEQKKVPGTCDVSAFQFNSEVKQAPTVALADVPPLTRANFRPKGNSAVHDALATAIDKVGEELAALPEDQRPDKVVVALISDGLERGSQTFSLEQVREKVHNQQASYAWLVCLLGANMDVRREAEKLGINPENSVRFTADNGGVRAGFHRLGNIAHNYRKGLGRSLTGADRPTRINLAAIAG